MKNPDRRGLKTASVWIRGPGIDINWQRLNLIIFLLPARKISGISGNGGRGFFFIPTPWRFPFVSMPDARNGGEMSERFKATFGKNSRSAKGQEAKKGGSRLFPLGLIVLLAVVPACSPSAGGTAVPNGATAAPAATNTSRPGTCDNPLYPVVMGASWNYHVTGAPTGDFDFSSAVTAVNVDGFVEEAAFPGLTRTSSWKCTPTGLALLSPGGGVSGTITTSSLNFNFTTTDYSGDTLPKRIAAGDTWTQTLTLHGESTLADGTAVTADGTDTTKFTAVGLESVTVPAGTFRAMRIDVVTVFTIETTVSGTTVPVTLNITGSAWYAPGIGMVKTVSTTEGIASMIVLTAYTIP